LGEVLLHVRFADTQLIFHWFGATVLRRLPLPPPASSKTFPPQHPPLLFHRPCCQTILRGMAAATTKIAPPSQRTPAPLTALAMSSKTTLLRRPLPRRLLCLPRRRPPCPVMVFNSKTTKSTRLCAGSFKTAGSASSGISSTREWT